MPTSCNPYWHYSSPLPSPAEIWEALPISSRDKEFQATTRQTIINILNGVDPRILVVAGPCSIHNTTAALEYAIKLKHLAKQVENTLFLVMRTHFEKPRSSMGWKGLFYDPLLNGSHQINVGIFESRKLLLALSNQQVPTATEFLDPISPCYFSDLISWGSIGARTTASQIHRQIASGLPMPIGFKNDVEGNLTSAIHGMISASHPHSFLGIHPNGGLCKVETTGNPYTHIVLRGSRQQSNYDASSVREALALLAQAKVRTQIMIDCSHDNCRKNPHKQIEVLHSVIQQILEGNRSIFGIMLESYHESGNQLYEPDNSKIQSSLSLTDPCLGWEETKELLLWADQQIGALCSYK